MARMFLMLLAWLASALFDGEGGTGGGTGDAGGSGDGGSGDKGDAGGSGSGDGGSGDDGGDADKLGDAGKKALEAERRARRDAEKRAKDAEAERDRLKQATETESEKKVREAAEAAKTETLATAKKIALRGTVLSAASGKLADPEDAIRLLDLDDFEIDDDGKLKEPEKLTKAIDALLKSKPYLAGKAGAATGSADGGTHGGGTKEEPTPGLGRLRAAYADSAKK